HKTVAKDASDFAIDRLDKVRHAKGGTPTADLRLKMQKTMQSNCAVFREGKVLQEGCEQMAALWAEKADLRVSDRSMIWNSDLVESLEFENLVSQAKVTIESARNREESR